MPGKRKRGGAYSVRFAGKEAVGNLRSRSNTLQAPTVSYTATSPELYTLIIYDPDSPSPSYLHWLVVNIPEDRVADGDTVVEYVPPTPPSGTHRYFVALFKQSTRISVPSLDRSGFSLDSFVTKYKLEAAGSKSICVQHEA